MTQQPDSFDELPDHLMPLVSEISQKLPTLSDLDSVLRSRDGAFRLALLLPEKVSASDIATETDTQRGWELVSSAFLFQRTE